MGVRFGSEGNCSDRPTLEDGRRSPCFIFVPSSLLSAGGYLRVEVSSLPPPPPRGYQSGVAAALHLYSSPLKSLEEGGIRPNSFRWGFQGQSSTE